MAQFTAAMINSQINYNSRERQELEEEKSDRSVPPRLIGIELNPGPTSSSSLSLAQFLFTDGILLICSYLTLPDVTRSLLPVSHHWQTSLLRERSRLLWKKLSALQLSHIIFSSRLRYHIGSVEILEKRPYVPYRWEYLHSVSDFLLTLQQLPSLQSYKASIEKEPDLNKRLYRREQNAANIIRWMTHSTRIAFHKMWQYRNPFRYQPSLTLNQHALDRNRIVQEEMNRAHAILQNPPLSANLTSLDLWLTELSILETQHLIDTIGNRLPHITHIKMKNISPVCSLASWSACSELRSIRIRTSFGTSWDDPIDIGARVRELSHIRQLEQFQYQQEEMTFERFMRECNKQQIVFPLLKELSRLIMKKADLALIGGVSNTILLDLHHCVPSLTSLMPDLFRRCDLLQLSHFAHLKTIALSSPPVDESRLHEAYDYNMCQLSEKELVDALTSSQSCIQLQHLILTLYPVIIQSPDSWSLLFDRLPQLCEFTFHTMSEEEGDILLLLQPHAARIHSLTLIFDECDWDLSRLSAFTQLHRLIIHGSPFLDKDSPAAMKSFIDDPNLMPQLEYFEVKDDRSQSFRYDRINQINTDCYRKPPAKRLVGIGLNPGPSQPESSSSASLCQVKVISKSQVISPASRLVGIELNPGPSSSFVSSSTCQSLVDRLHSIELQLIMHLLDLRHRIFVARLTRSTLQMCENTSFAWQNALLPLRLPNVVDSSSTFVRVWSEAEIATTATTESRTVISSRLEEAATTAATAELVSVSPSTDDHAKSLDDRLSTRLLRHCPIALSIHTQDFIDANQLVASLSSLSSSLHQHRIIELEVRALDTHINHPLRLCVRDDDNDEEPEVDESEWDYATDSETGEYVPVRPPPRPLSRYMIIARLLGDDKNEMRNRVHTLRLLPREYLPSLHRGDADAEQIPECWIEPSLTLPSLTSLQLTTYFNRDTAELIVSGVTPSSLTLQHLSFDCHSEHRAVDLLLSCKPLQNSLRSFGFSCYMYDLASKSSLPELHRFTQLEALHLIEPQHRTLVALTPTILLAPKLRHLFLTTPGNVYPGYITEETFAHIDTHWTNITHLTIAVLMPRPLDFTPGKWSPESVPAMRDWKKFIELEDAIQRVKARPQGMRLHMIFHEGQILDRLTSLTPPPAPRLVGIELNPGPPTSSPVAAIPPIFTAQDLFTDALHMIFDYFTLEELSLSPLLACRHWYTTASSRNRCRNESIRMDVNQIRLFLSSSLCHHCTALVLDLPKVSLDPQLQTFNDFYATLHQLPSLTSYATRIRQDVSKLQLDTMQNVASNLRELEIELPYHRSATEQHQQLIEYLAVLPSLTSLRCMNLISVCSLQSLSASSSSQLAFLEITLYLDPREKSWYELTSRVMRDLSSLPHLEYLKFNHGTFHSNLAQCFEDGIVFPHLLKFDSSLECVDRHKQKNVSPQFMSQIAQCLPALTDISLEDLRECDIKLLSSFRYLTSLELNQKPFIPRLPTYDDPASYTFISQDQLASLLISQCPLLTHLHVNHRAIQFNAASWQRLFEGLPQLISLSFQDSSASSSPSPQLDLLETLVPYAARIQALTLRLSGVCESLDYLLQFHSLRRLILRGPSVLFGMTQQQVWDELSSPDLLPQLEYFEMTQHVYEPKISKLSPPDSSTCFIYDRHEAGDYRQTDSSILIPPAALLVGIEPNPGPPMISSESMTAQSLFTDAIHMINSFLATCDWLNACHTCHPWYAAAGREPCRKLTVFSSSSALLSSSLLLSPLRRHINRVTFKKEDEGNHALTLTQFEQCLSAFSHLEHFEVCLNTRKEVTDAASSSPQLELPSSSPPASTTPRASRLRYLRIDLAFPKLDYEPINTCLSRLSSMCPTLTTLQLDCPIQCTMDLLQLTSCRTLRYLILHHVPDPLAPTEQDHAFVRFLVLTRFCQAMSQHQLESIEYDLPPKIISALCKLPQWQHVYVPLMTKIGMEADGRVPPSLGDLVHVHRAFPNLTAISLSHFSYADLASIGLFTRLTSLRFKDSDSLWAQPKSLTPILPILLLCPLLTHLELRLSNDRPLSAVFPSPSPSTSSSAFFSQQPSNESVSLLFSSCPQLTSLHLRSSQNEDPVPLLTSAALPSGASVASRLQRIELDGIYLAGSSIQLLAVEFTSLRTLLLNDCLASVPRVPPSTTPQYRYHLPRLPNHEKWSGEFDVSHPTIGQLGLSTKESLDLSQTPWTKSLEPKRYTYERIK